MSRLSLPTRVSARPAGKGDDEPLIGDIQELNDPGGPLNLARIAWDAAERADKAEARVLRLERENAELRACLTRAAKDLARFVDRSPRPMEAR